VMEDAVDGVASSDEADDVHRGRAPGADERVDLVHPAEEVGPTLAQRGSGRPRKGLLFEIGVGASNATVPVAPPFAPGGTGVVAVVMVGMPT